MLKRTLTEQNKTQKKSVPNSKRILNKKVEFVSKFNDATEHLCNL